MKIGVGNEMVIFETNWPSIFLKQFLNKKQFSKKLGVKRWTFSSIFFKFSEQKFLLANVTYGTFFTENARLQEWDFPEHANVTSQRRTSEDLIYGELPYRVGTQLILTRRYILL